MLDKFKIIKTIIIFIIPYIFLYSIYILLNGEISPGGGFQAGVIFATGFIAYDLIFGYKQSEQYFKADNMIIYAIIGVAIYASTGAISLIYGDNYLNYNSIANNNIIGQHIGIFCIELGVGMSVSSIMCLIYSLLQER